MKIGLVGDYDRHISVVGHGVVPAASESWESMGLEAFTLQMIPNRQENPPSTLSSHLIPVLMTGRDTLVITDPDDISKSQYLLYVLNLLGTRPRTHDNFNEGPRAIIVVPTEDRAQRVAEWVLVHGTNMVDDKGLEFSVKVRALVGEKPRFYRSDDLVVGTPTSLVRFLDKNHKRFKDLTKFVKCLIFERTNESIVRRGEYTMMRKILFLLAPLPQPNPHPQLIIFSGDHENVCCLSEFARHLPETHFIVISSPRKGIVGKAGQGRKRTTVPGDKGKGQADVPNSSLGGNVKVQPEPHGPNAAAQAQGEPHGQADVPNSSLAGNVKVQPEPHGPNAAAQAQGEPHLPKETPPEEVPLDPGGQTAFPSH